MLEESLVQDNDQVHESEEKATFVIQTNDNLKNIVISARKINQVDKNTTKYKFFLGLTKDTNSFNDFKNVQLFIDDLEDDLKLLKEGTDKLLCIQMEEKDNNGKVEIEPFIYNGIKWDKTWYAGSQRSKWWAVFTALISVFSTAASLILYNDFLRDKLLPILDKATSVAGVNCAIGGLAFLYSIFSIGRSITSYQKYNDLIKRVTKEIEDFEQEIKRIELIKSNFKKNLPVGDELEKIKEIVIKLVSEIEGKEIKPEDLPDGKALNYYDKYLGLWLQVKNKEKSRYIYDKNKHFLRGAIFTIMFIGSVLAITQGAFFLAPASFAFASSNVMILLPKILLLASEILVTSYNYLEHRGKKKLFTQQEEEYASGTMELKIDEVPGELEFASEERKNEEKKQVNTNINEQHSHDFTVPDALVANENLAHHEGRTNKRNFKRADYTTEGIGKTMVAAGDLTLISTTVDPTTFNVLGGVDLGGGIFIFLAEFYLLLHMYDGYKDKKALDGIPNKFKDLMEELFKPIDEIQDKELKKIFVEVYREILKGQRQGMMEYSAKKIENDFLSGRYETQYTGPKCLGIKEQDPEGKIAALQDALEIERSKDKSHNSGGWCNLFSRNRDVDHSGSEDSHESSFSATRGAVITAV